MATYAMICNNRVIEVLYNLDAAPKWPPDPSDNPVTAIVCSDDATRDWAYDPETGEVFEPVSIAPEENEPVEKPHSQLDRIEEKLNALTADSVTTESIEAAILEGVNEV